MINYIAIIVCIFSVLFSLIEGSNYLDTHHDAIIFSNSIFIMNGLLPYKDFYVQYGIIQPTINAVLFSIFGARFLIQNLVVAVVYALFLYFNFKIVKIILNEKVALLFLLILFFLDPFVILPWPNFFIGLFSCIGLYYFTKHIKYENINFFFISMFFFCLLPLTRINAGIIIIPILLIYSSYILYRNKSIVNLLKLIASLTPLLLLLYLFSDEDFIKQAVILPSEYILPLYFKIPNDILYIAALHINLFFLEPNLFSGISATEILFFWRYILILGIIVSTLYIFLQVIRGKISDKSTLLAFIFACCSGSMSSSVFPIFDSFRAINAWYPFLLILFIILFKNISSRKFYAVGVSLLTFIAYINITTPAVSIYTLSSLYKFDNFKIQFVDFSKKFKVSSRDQFDNVKGEPQSLKLNEYQRLPLSQYSKLDNILKTKCVDKKFISTSEDFFIYLLIPDMYSKLAHKMYYYQAFTTLKGIPVDANRILYPEFTETLNSHDGLCFLHLHRKPNILLDDLIKFSDEIKIGDHSVFIR